MCFEQALTRRVSFVKRLFGLMISPAGWARRPARAWRQSQQVRPAQVVKDLSACRTPRRRLAGPRRPGRHRRNSASMLASSRAGKRVLQLADQGQALPVTAHRLAGLAQPGVRDAQRVPRHGQRRGVAGRGARLQSLPGVAAGQLVVPQASVAFAEPGQGPALPGLVAGLPEQRQGLLRTAWPLRPSRLSRSTPGWRPGATRPGRAGHRPGGGDPGPGPGPSSQRR